MKNCNGNLIMENRPRIISYASVVGKKEEEGPLHEYFDRVIRDSYAGKDTFEQAESEILSTAVRIALNKSGLEPEDIDIACCGDLLNQCVASSFAMRSYGIPYAGVYGACSTMALGMIVGAAAIEGGAAHRAVCAASSHYCTAERQYRFPLEYGSQRPPTAQWTVTGAGVCVLEKGSSAAVSRPVSNRADKEKPADGQLDRPTNGVDMPANDNSSNPCRTDSQEPCPYLHAARIGKILDYNITDQNNMGAAMAPAIVKIGT